MKWMGAVGLTVIMILVLGMGTAFAAGTSVDSFPVSFVLSSATCSHLPVGTTINGSGTETSITTIRTDQSGVTTIINATHAYGTATDQVGNGYAFNYNNEFRVSNSVADPGALTGLMTDSFALAGSGTARLSNGFVANITLAPTFEAQPISAHGDPISFPEGTAHCDPL